MGLYYPSGLEDSPDSPFTDWFMHINGRLDDWYKKTRQSVYLSEKIEFHELMYQIQIMRLNRPSPRCPNPTKEMNNRALKSAVALIKEFSIINRLGRLFNIWHAAFVIVESGICLLALTLAGIESDGQSLTLLEGEDVTVLMRYIKTLPILLWRVSRRWPNIACHASTIENISLSVLEKLQEWSNGKAVERPSSYALKQRLNQISSFSPSFPGTKFPSEGPVLPYGVDNGITERASWHSYDVLQPGLTHPTLAPTRDIVYPESNDPTATMQSYSTPGNSELPIPPTGMVSLPSSDPVPRSQDFPDVYDTEGGDLLAPDFDGMDFEEIFAALLDGGQMPLSNDFTDMV